MVALGTLGALNCGKGWGNRCASDDDCLFSGDEWTLIQSLANVSRTAPPGDDSNELLDAASWDMVRSASQLGDVPAIVRLGRRLYHDGRLSGDNLSAKDSVGRETPPPRASKACSAQLGISCADCHDPARYGSDFTSLPPNVSNGAGYYDVNTQQTLNVARFAPVFYWNGRADSLWSQAAQVMESAVSMHSRREKTLWLMAQCYRQDQEFIDAFASQPALRDEITAVAPLFVVPTPAAAKTGDYQTSFAQVVKDNPAVSPTLATRVHVAVAKAIAAYEWYLTSDGARFDRFVDAGPASGLLTASEKRGLKLFIGHAGCVNCHNTSLLSDRRFHNIGIGQSGDHVPTVGVCTKGNSACDCTPPTAAADGGPVVGGKCLPAGAYAGMQKLHADDTTDMTSTTVFRRCPDERYGCSDGGGPNEYSDAGTALPPPRWLGAWRTPSLRDVAMTAPYMHDGSLATLADVVWHYDQGGASAGMGTSELAPLNLTAQDRADLVAFLGTLTGQPGPALLITPPDPEPSCYPATFVDAAVPGCAPSASADAGADGP